jgi:hypothetical protein
MLRQQRRNGTHGRGDQNPILGVMVEGARGRVEEKRRAELRDEAGALVLVPGSG